jgi:ubiquitin C-terminal hydrolase
VTIPQPLSMDMHLIRNAKEDGLYYLRGTVEHTGELNYGQYIDACRSNINGNWYDFNDSSVYENNKKFSDKT